MQVYQPKIAIGTLTDKQLEIFHDLNDDMYGIELATKIAEKLMQTNENKGLLFNHRDYCGLGLFYHQQRFILYEVEDGNSPNNNFLFRKEDVVASFDTQQEFIHWLANENDKSMSLYGSNFNNQTITKIRLLWFLQKDYSSSLNAFYNFLGGFLRGERQLPD